jgi:alpha-glucosidase
VSADDNPSLLAETSRPSLPWWADAVVYQIYPRSFADSDGDGIGDLPGVRDRLPYLAELGVDAIWLTPFYPSPLRDGGYDVSDYTDVDPRLGTLDEFDRLVEAAARHDIRVLVDLVPNHCSAEHPLFKAALAAERGGRERDMFIFREGHGPGGEAPPNNWPSNFGGPAWTRVADGQWYLHLFDSGQPDWNWRNPQVREMFNGVIRFWLDRKVAGLRIDVAHGMFKDPDLADTPSAVRSIRPSGYYHRPELHELYRTWRAILDSYPPDAFPGQRTAIGEVWYDTYATLAPYLAPDGLPQVFNFELVTAKWNAADIRAAIDATLALTDGSQAPWVIGNHDVVRPVTRWGPDAARAAALLLLALPGSAYLYQGEELGLPEVLDIPDAARQDPAFRRTGGKVRGRDGCRVPLPWDRGGGSFGFSRTDAASSPAATVPVGTNQPVPVGTNQPASVGTNQPAWLPQPADWGRYSVAAERDIPGSFLGLYRDALRLRRAHPALGEGRMRWLDAPPDTLVFARDPGFVFAANLGGAALPLPPHREVLLASAPFTQHGELAADAAAWLAV